MKAECSFDKFRFILLLIAFVSTSYASIFPVMWIDDAIVLALGVLLLLQIKARKQKIGLGLSTYWLLFVFSSLWMIVSLIGTVNKNEAITSYLVFVKILILITSCLLPSSQKSDEIKRLNLFIYLSIPNLVLGLNEYYLAYIKKQYIAYGKYELDVGFRLQGATGHPIFYSLLLVMCVCCFLFFLKNKISIILAIICSFLCYYTWSSFSFALVIFLWILKTFSLKKNGSSFKKLAKVLLPITIIISIVFLILYMQKETYTIRYISMKTTIQNLNAYNLIIGNGFGTFSKAGLSEAYIFRVLYECGVIGLATLFIPLWVLMKNNKKNGNYVGMFVLTSYILNDFINEGYVVPFMFFIPIFCGINKRLNISTNNTN